MDTTLELGRGKEVGKIKGMFEDVSRNSRKLFQPPILKFTLISITINFSFHIG